MNQEKSRYEDPTPRDWVIGIGLIVIFLVVIGIGAYFLIPDHIIWWLVLIVSGVLLLTFNQNRNYALRCRVCGHEFEISFLKNLISPHGIDKEESWLWVRCPDCGEKGKVSVIRIAREN